MAKGKKEKNVEEKIEERKLALFTLIYNPNNDILEVSTNGMWGSVVELYQQILRFLGADGLISLVQQERQVGASLLQQQLKAQSEPKEKE